MLDRLWKAIGNALFGDARDAAEREEDARIRAQDTAPVLWLLGKTGAAQGARPAAPRGRARYRPPRLA
jgi:hypothetical protein